MGTSTSKLKPSEEKKVPVITIGAIQPMTSDSILNAAGAILPVGGNRGSSEIAKEITKRFGI